MSNTLQECIIEQIRQERKRQDKKWGDQNWPPVVWCAILGEEKGEVDQAALESLFEDYYRERDGKTLEDYKQELIQVAAVAVAAIESLTRQEITKQQNITDMEEIKKHFGAMAKPERWV